ncbi:hypothetical protein OAT35_01115 [Candidatus Pelagibacter sp.]|nr:hypothetical protein [Candidatus Pelagibacter sp.]
MKTFYSCVDALIPSPLSEQHLIINNKAEKEGGSITAYASEEYRAVKNQPWIFTKLSETKGLNGVIFFTALQFSYGNRFNIKLFEKLINNNYEIHFAREDLSFSKQKPNIKSLNFLISNSLVYQRNLKELINLI